MKYLRYKCDQNNGSAGLSDRRSCLSILLSESKLTGRIAVIPKFILTGEHNNGHIISSYLIDTYFRLDKITDKYIFEEDFDILGIHDCVEISQDDDILHSDAKLVVRHFLTNHFYQIQVNRILDVASHIHSFGVKNVIPMFIPTPAIFEESVNILKQLPRPIVGITFRRMARLNPKLNESMQSEVILKKLEIFEYSSVVYGSNDNEFSLCGNNIYNIKDFIDSPDNYYNFSVTMSVIDGCDISVRTFSDSYIYFHKETIGRNYHIADYSMHDSHVQTDDIPRGLILQEYVPNKFT
jgi:hypothetical protein